MDELETLFWFGLIGLAMSCGITLGSWLLSFVTGDRKRESERLQMMKENNERLTVLVQLQKQRAALEEVRRLGSEL